MDTNFGKKKAALSAFLDKCAAFTEQNGYAEQRAKLLEAKKTLTERKIAVVVIGEAKRGKSTLITALTEEVGLFPI
ncbi:hypothetical protein AGMMS50276_03630 [Synergistales bacterium]|nr:hypothetical protein AGMMS50276_03630 [Synergistales bacterium]